MFDLPDEVVDADPLFGHTRNFMSLVKHKLPKGFKEVATFSLGGRDFHLLKAEAQKAALAAP